MQTYKKNCNQSSVNMIIVLSLQRIRVYLTFEFLLFVDNGKMPALWKRSLFDF